MGDTYSKEWCPKCKTTNWFCHGDLSDQTSSMGEEPAAQCWECGHRWWLPPYDTDEFERTNVFEQGGWLDHYPDATAWFASKDLEVQIGKEKP